MATGPHSLQEAPRTFGDEQKRNTHPAVSMDGPEHSALEQGRDVRTVSWARGFTGRD
jgi:hypothetical protein